MPGRWIFCHFSFQSTLSMRRATASWPHNLTVTVISIHALHEESDFSPADIADEGDISIHALHEESDGRTGWVTRHADLFQSMLSMRRATSKRGSVIPRMIFQSTLSMRRATACRHATCATPSISIHALHEESDPSSAQPVCCWGDISIHALHEESDLGGAFDIDRILAFQSTLSMRRVTAS